MNLEDEARAALRQCELREPANVGKARSWQEVMAMTNRPEWIVDEFGTAGGCVLLAADKGCGKSSLMYGMAAAIQDGAMFMGQLQTQKRKILFWQGDEPASNMRNKLVAMGVQPNESQWRFLLKEDGFNFFDLQTLDRFAKSDGIGVVFIDSISSLMLGQGVSMRDPEFSSPLYDLAHWSAKNNVLTILASHLRKSSDDVKSARQVTSDSIIGSGLQTAAVTDIWSLEEASKPEFEDHYVLRCLGKRNCQKGTIWNLQGSKEDFSWRLNSVGVDDLLPRRMHELRFAFLKTLAESDKRFHSDELADANGCSKEHARRICRELYGQKEIERHALPSTGGRRRWVYSALPQEGES